MYASTTLRYSVYRYIIVLEQSFRNLTPFIPRPVLLAKQLACDPLPPLTASSEYNDVFFAGAEEIFSVHSRRRDAWALERLIPDTVVDCRWRVEVQRTRCRMRMKTRKMRTRTRTSILL
ncbi:hypothetical protein EV702DRAFT_362759 [Suillus placidus]|uniref:Uncharacterized protein n=1 Tax=Suillus placidus TaxID=48579 RepID=A0A9P7D1Y2_9AGAM|nr:hypothetical protein EV702DRAFT_362759 [Suillus placidus]